MPSNVAVDDHLLAEAKRVGGHRTKKEAVFAALKEYVQDRKREQAKIIELFGKIQFDRKYNYKKQRRR